MAAPPSLIIMPQQVLESIARASSAVDMYSLVQCCKQLWCDTALKRSMIRCALDSRLDDCLRGIALEHFDEEEDWSFSAADIFPPGLPAFVTDRGLCNLNSDSAKRGHAPQVLIAGSIPVAAALGKVWHTRRVTAEKNCSDVDIFCTAEAAPKVRQRLIEQCNLICSGANDSYVLPAVTAISTPDDSPMHHVEGYAAAKPRSGFYRDLSAAEFYTRALEYGRAELNPSEKELRMREELRSYGFDKRGKIGMPGGSAGGDFPYDFSLERDTFVQLIVGKETCHDARDLLNSFDLTICQTYFDGVNFHIPSPRETLCGKTTVLAARHALVSEFFRNTCAGLQLPDYHSVVAEMNNDVWAAVGVSRHIAMLGSPGVGGFDPLEFVMKLILRMQKYHNRGVEILDVPGNEKDNIHALNFQTYLQGVYEYERGPAPPM